MDGHEQRLAAAAQKLAARDRLDFKAVAGTAEGRRFLARLLLVCETGLAAFSPDALEMARRCGKHEVGRFVDGLFGDCNHLKVQMLSEAAADAEILEWEIENGRND